MARRRKRNRSRNEGDRRLRKGKRRQQVQRRLKRLARRTRPIWPFVTLLMRYLIQQLLLELIAHLLRHNQ